MQDWMICKNCLKRFCSETLICVYCFLHADTSLRDGLFHEYKKYGKVNAVLVAGVGEERYAIVSFRK